jgi:hypothetical protein
MAGLVQNTLSVIPDIVKIDDKESKASISETLKSISNIGEEETLPVGNDIGDVNELLVGHFARAIKIAKRLVDIDDQHNVVLSLLDRMPIALVLVDAKARVIETNALADELLLSEDGLRITSNILDSGTENNGRLLDAVEMMSKHDPAITRGQTLSITNEQKTILCCLLRHLNSKKHNKKHLLQYLFLNGSPSLYPCQKKCQIYMV